MGKLIKFDHVNTHGDFEKLLSHYGIDYAKRGNQLRALCPLHEDTNPSLSIALEADGDTKPNTFHCFGCHQSGSIIDFAAHLDGGTLREGAEIVAELSGCGVAPAKTSGKTPAKGAKRPAKGRKSGKGANPRPSADNTGTGHSESSDDVSGGDPGNKPLKFALTLDRDHPYVVERVGLVPVHPPVRPRVHLHPAAKRLILGWFRLHAPASQARAVVLGVVGSRNLMSYDLSLARQDRRMSAQNRTSSECQLLYL